MIQSVTSADSEPADATGGDTASSYCCECGTYDAHLHVCACCGFDFRSDVADADA